MLQHGDDVVNCLKEKQRNVYLNISKAPLSVVPGAIVIYSCYHVIEYKYICMYIHIIYIYISYITLFYNTTFKTVVFSMFIPCPPGNLHPRPCSRSHSSGPVKVVATGWRGHPTEDRHAVRR